MSPLLGDTQESVISLCEGKYTYIRLVKGGQKALRYGGEWRDLTGDGFVLAMAQKIEDQSEEIERLRAALGTAESALAKARQAQVEYCEEIGYVENELPADAFATYDEAISAIRAVLAAETPK